MITKPVTWVVHLEKENVVPIFSIDVSPSGDCFATGGEDGKVKVWSLAKALDPDCQEPSLLSEIEAHEQPVNSVRFHSNGNCLASGGSDGAVAVFFGCRTDWKPFRRWRRHELDVSEVAWGTRERRSQLASCGLDGLIVIWDVQKGHPMQTLTGHSSMIKGMAWDPLGQYLATQAEMEGVFIWRTSDWKCVKKMSEPFASSVEGSDHLRLSWSPDGRFLTGVQAYRLPQPFAAVFGRDRWHLDCCIVGHTSGVSISKWNPKLFSSKGQERLDMCLCLGSIDRSFSLWMQTKRHPMLHMDGFFENRISDLAWSADGYTLLVASRDGCVALCNFSEKDLGMAVDYKMPIEAVMPTSSKMPVAENLQLWMMEKESMDVDKRIRLDTDDVQGTLHKRQKKAEFQNQQIEPMLHELTSSKTPSPPKTIEKSKGRDVVSDKRSPNRTSRSTTLICSCGVRLRSGEGRQVHLKAENGNGMCVVVCLEDEREIWKREIAGRAVVVAGNVQFSVVATDASALNVFDETGMLMLSSIILPSPASHAITDGEWHLLTITQCQELSLWNVRDLSEVRLSDNGLPIVSLSDGRSYLYSASMEAWTVYSDADRMRTGHATALIGRGDDDLSARAFSFHPSADDARHELERGISNAIDLGNASEYRSWIVAHIRFLIVRISQHGISSDETRLRKICLDLLKEESIDRLDVHPMIFLKSKILPEIAKAKDLQRLYMELNAWIPDV